MPRPPKKIRADRLLVERGLAESQAKAQAFIMAGRVSSDGRRVEKAGELLTAGAPLFCEPVSPFVGRGGLKLAEALDAFGVSPAGLTCADIGASTGGFTDCLLQRGAAKVFAVDVTTSQLDDRLRRNPRVVPVERNARNLKAADLGEPVDLAVMDVSFISILKILPALAAVLRGGEAILLSLIKPQFEAARDRVGERGIIRDPEVHREVLTRIAGGAREAGFALTGLLRLVTRGRKGNVEFFGRFVLREPSVEPLPRDVIESVDIASGGTSS
ncbi:MAG: TlyA family RNA methyltransferase [Candidatus Aminicenantes bacterium]|nr:TlyA family RNA methyltransferase [Candidatus Aminicenantes bacterium]